MEKTVKLRKKAKNKKGTEKMRWKRGHKDRT